MRFAAVLLGAVTATQVKSQAQMLAEIESMSMNANMHQVSLREKTLLKSYLEVDMNEFFQEKMDSELFEGLDEKQKAEFIGNFFHWVKCRFQDCSLAQIKSKAIKHNPAEVKKEDDKKPETKKNDGTATPPKETTTTKPAAAQKPVPVPVAAPTMAQ